MTSSLISSDLEFESWSEFKEHVLDVIETGVDKTPVSDLWFRGHRRSDWTLTSSFDRIHAKLPLEQRQLMHKQMLEAFRERGQLVAKFSDDIPENELYALLQHHGAPTKLLDWTTSPYIAAFFAFAGSIDVETDADDMCAIHILNAASPVWRAGSGVSLIRLRQLADQRILNQRGYFTLNESLHSSLDDYIESFSRTPQSGPSWVLQRWLIPYRVARLALRDLELMGISSESMFPGLDGSSRYAYFRATVDSAQ